MRQSLRSWPGRAPLVLAAALVFVASCGRPHEANTAVDAAPANDGRLVIRAEDVPDQKPVVAVLTNRDAGAARARIGGSLIKLSVREGDVVKKGDVIAVVADERRNFEARAGASAATAAEARATQAHTELARIEELFKSGVYAQARLDDARAAAKAADAQLRSARAGSAALDEVARQGEVLAPADGRIVKAPVPEGAVVMAGEVVAEVATGRRVLRLEIPEADGVKLKVGEAIPLPASGARPAAKAAILQIYPAVEDGKIIVDADAASLDGGFVGMRTPALIPVGARRAILIPAAYVSTRDGVDTVRLARDHGAVIDAPVLLGAAFVADGGRKVEILSGLVDGDVLMPPSSLTKSAEGAREGA